MTDDTVSLPPARFHAEIILDQRRVIARLLDGWTPVEGEWVRSRLRSDEPYLAPMSDGEAAIIRNHQEKTP